jgi:SAM-dependent methyltransferase
VDEQLRRFYEEAYQTGCEGERFGRWRLLTGATKAQHVISLVRSAGLTVDSVADIGCGDGSLLDSLERASFGTRRIGYEISSSAVALAAGRRGVDEVHLFDGVRLPAEGASYDLVIASHVVEHVGSPVALMRELARVGRHVVIEVPLEANLAALRPSARAASADAGHVHRFSRRDARALAAEAGLDVVAEVLDPLPLAVHLFGRTSPLARLAGVCKWAARDACARIPFVGSRLITLHYAFIASPHDRIDRAEKTGC